MNKSIKKIICYGEVLWDQLSSNIRPAGAPINVAYHLNKLGIKSCIISNIGNDFLGKDLLKILKKWRINISSCKENNTFPTGKVLAKVDPTIQDINYEIMEPVAWDFISLSKNLTKIIKKTDGLVFQSLTTRSENSRKTLFSLLEFNCYKIFDLNLRYPFYSEKIIKDLLKKSDIVKMSIAELNEIVSWFKKKTISEKEAILFLKECFSLKEVLISKGSYGASYYAITNLYEQIGTPICVKDPIGSGDAFLAGFLSKKINGNPNEEAINLAIAMGAFVASKDESCPCYNINSINKSNIFII